MTEETVNSIADKIVDELNDSWNEALNKIRQDIAKDLRIFVFDVSDMQDAFTDDKSALAQMKKHCTGSCSSSAPAITPLQIERLAEMSLRFGDNVYVIEDTDHIFRETVTASNFTAMKEQLLANNVFHYKDWAEEELEARLG